MAKKYARINGGDSVLIDIGGWGIEAKLDADGQAYRVRYVQIHYDPESGKPTPSLVPAAMTLTLADGTITPPFEGARRVTIYRHGE